MIVVDAAVIVDVLALAPGTDDLRAGLAGEQLHAPALIDYELVSAVRGLVLGGHLSPARAEDLLTDYADVPVRRWPSSDPQRRRALQLRTNVSAYDAAYLVLAEALECPLVTRDARLARSTGHSVRIDLF